MLEEITEFAEGPSRKIVGPAEGEPAFGTVGPAVGWLSIGLADANPGPDEGAEDDGDKTGTVAPVVGEFALEGAIGLTDVKLPGYS